MLGVFGGCGGGGGSGRSGGNDNDDIDYSDMAADGLDIERAEALDSLPIYDFLFDETTLYDGQ